VCPDSPLSRGLLYGWCAYALTCPRWRMNERIWWGPISAASVEKRLERRKSPSEVIAVSVALIVFSLFPSLRAQIR